MIVVGQNLSLETISPAGNSYSLRGFSNGTLGAYSNFCTFFKFRLFRGVFWLKILHCNVACRSVIYGVKWEISD